jgi:Zn-dependent protease with chaperone function
MELVVGFSTLILETLVNQMWSGAIIAFLLVTMLTVNIIAYNVSGFTLIRILRNHQRDGPTASGGGEDISGSKSATPFDIVIRKTVRSMFMLTLPSLGTLILFLFIGASASNTKPRQEWDPIYVPWPLIVVLFLQLMFGFLFTRVGWVSKAALESAIVGKASTPSTSMADSAEKKSRASKAEGGKSPRMSQSPKPRFSELTPSGQISRPEADIATTADQEPAPAVPTIQVSEVPDKVDVVVV